MCICINQWLLLPVARICGSQKQGVGLVHLTTLQGLTCGICAPHFHKYRFCRISGLDIWEGIIFTTGQSRAIFLFSTLTWSCSYLLVIWASHAIAATKVEATDSNFCVVLGLVIYNRNRKKYVWNCNIHEEQIFVFLHKEIMWMGHYSKYTTKWKGN